MKKRIRLTEQDLHRVIEESVKRILEGMYHDFNVDSRGATDGTVNENFLNYYLAGMDTLRFAGPSSREGRHDRTRLGGRIANLYDYFKWKKKRYDLSDEWQKKEREEERMARKKR